MDESDATERKAEEIDALRREVEGIDWWHIIDLGDGVVTPGIRYSRTKLERMQMPEDLTGKSVLDIGCWDGLYSFEAERRGADTVLAVDHRVPEGFMVARRELGSRVEFRELDVMDLSPQAVGRFDVVFFMGVLYHVPDPIGALRRVHACTRELMILETASSYDWRPDPVMAFRGSNEALSDPALNWWLPNPACAREMCRAVGFERATQVAGPPPPPESPALRLGKKLLRRVLPRTFGPKDTRLVVHASP